MTIDVKYNVGDNIRYIKENFYPVWEPCPCCDGKKYIIGADERKYQCPNCEGHGKVMMEDDMRTEEEKTGTIDSVHVTYDSNMDSYHGKPNIFYTIPQSVYHIPQENVLGKI